MMIHIYGTVENYSNNKYMNQVHDNQKFESFQLVNKYDFKDDYLDDNDSDEDYDLEDDEFTSDDDNDEGDEDDDLGFDEDNDLDFDEDDDLGDNNPEKKEDDSDLEKKKNSEKKTKTTTNDNSEDTEESWVDIYSQLFSRRILFLCQDLEEEMTNGLLNILLLLHKKDKEKFNKKNRIFFQLANKPSVIWNKNQAFKVSGINYEQIMDVHLFINSTGGPADYGLGLFDVEKYIIPEVNTICLGKSHSTTNLVISGGEFGKRVGCLHSQYFLYEPLAGDNPTGTSFDLFLEAAEAVRIKWRFFELFSISTNHSLTTVVQDFIAGTLLNVQLAFDYGIIDGVLKNFVDYTQKKMVYTMDALV